MNYVTDLLLFVLPYLVNAIDPEVTIPLGTIRGRQIDVYGQKVDEFLGVPYAKPPIKEFRFAKPEQITEKWEKPFIAQSYSSACYQNNKPFKVSEDCLYLNIWRTANSKQTNALKPVLFWIHGGGFTGGSALQYNSSILAKSCDCVVVTINYRLFIFGFLYGNNNDAPGNVGLYDQLAALEWVSANIEYFGGDKHQVTIFGESAGGWSTSLHLMSPLSRPFYSKAIVMSGMEMDYLGTDPTSYAIKRAKVFATVAGCPYTGDPPSLPSDVIKCLRGKDAEAIYKAAEDKRVKAAAPSLVWGVPFLPVFGETFLPTAPREIWKNKQFKPNTSLLIGTVYNEFLLNGFVKPGVKPSDTLRWFCSLFVPSQLLTKTDCEELIKMYYIGIDEVKQRELAVQTVSDFYNDLVFHCPSIAFAEAFSEVNNVYQYFFNYKSKSDNPGCGPTYPCHGSDIALTFGQVRNPADFWPTVVWLKMISDFAKTGKTFWPQYYKTSAKELVPVYYEFKGGYSVEDTHIALKDFRYRMWKSMVLKKKYL